MPASAWTRAARVSALSCPRPGLPARPGPADWEDKRQALEQRLQAEKQRTEELDKRLKWQEQRSVETTGALLSAARLADQISDKDAHILRLEEEGMTRC